MATKFLIRSMLLGWMKRLTVATVSAAVLADTCWAQVPAPCGAPKKFM